jgi:hypothetical protein
VQAARWGVMNLVLVVAARNIKNAAVFELLKEE